MSKVEKTEAGRELSTIETINKEINKQLTKETGAALLATTFKGLTAPLMKQAMMEGMLRGYTFKDFIEKNIYAIPFKDRKTGMLGYSLITSIDHARKIGMRSGVVGVSAPSYEEDENKKIVSCSVTVKRKVGEYVGEYTAKVYFSEYNTGFQQWASKPRTMIAKVAEMHALRKACPEELSQSYVEEEMQKEVKIVESEVVKPNEGEYREKLEKTTSLAELQKVWSSIPVEAKKALGELKDQLKNKYATA